LRPELPFRRLAVGCTATGAATAAALALLWLSCASAHAQTKLTARYALSLADIGIGEGDWAVEIGKDRYTTQSSGRFFGVWRVMLGSDIAATARGTTAQGHLAPTSYEANFSWDDDVEDVRMTFHDGLVSEFETKPPAPAGPDRIPVAAAQLRGVVDPLTAGLVAMPGAGDLLAPSACRRTLPIFDGSHRFDMALSFKRMDTVKMEAGYQGPAVVCAMTYRPLAGYTPGAFRVNYLKANHDMEMWFAPIAGTRMLAVIRISIPTMLGTAVLKAVRFESATR
jgi:Protein of unknown function (DUF3108)